MADRASVERALAYPFDVPDHSYRLGNDGAQPWEPTSADVRGRTPVVAAGSNAAPAQLRRKFEGWRDLAIPVERVTLRDVVPVYSAHVTRYGSIPATLAWHPGARATLHVTWLREDELKLMHRTEALGRNYDFVRLPFARVERGAAADAPLFAYQSLHGGLLREGAPVALRALPCEGHPWPALEQAEILAWAHERLRALAPPHLPIESGFEAFVASLAAARRDTREACSRLLRTHHGRPVPWPEAPPAAR